MVLVETTVPLAGTILEPAQRPRDGAALGEQARDIHRIEPRGRPRARHFDHDVQLGHVVVHDPESHAAVVQPRRHRQIGARRVEHAAGVVVQQQLPALGDARQGEDCVHRAARHHARFDQQAVAVEACDEGDLASAGLRDLGAQQGDDRGREPLDAHVLSSRFFAAGNRTLLRISR